MRTTGIISLLALLLFSCAEEKPQNRTGELESRNDKLVRHNRLLYQTIDVLERQLNDVDKQVDFLIAKQGVDLSNIEKRSKQDILLSKLKQIERSLDHGRYMITQLESEKDQKIRNEEVLTKQLGELRSQLKVLTSARDSLVEQIRIELLNQEMLQDEILSLDLELQGTFEELNKAYFTFGTREELVHHQVIEYAGGFLGMFQKPQLHSDLNESYFTPLSRMENYHIPLRTAKAQLVTRHPADSFRFCEKEGKIECLEITDPEAFWRFSNRVAILVQ